jgi:hypothetical protein
MYGLYERWEKMLGKGGSSLRTHLILQLLKKYYWQVANDIRGFFNACLLNTEWLAFHRLTEWLAFHRLTEWLAFRWRKG